ncbi:ferroxidase fet3 [Chytridiales sp. JEL 0842]|nr:ferroxidase fet3 [Chytridiales sp. JEL 0842]
MKFKHSHKDQTPCSYSLISATLLAIAASVLLDAAESATVVYNWTVARIHVNYDGVSRNAFGINGMSSHKTAIEVNTGDRVIVNVTNALDVPTSIHWHGLTQAGTPFMDGVSGVTQCPIAPGSSFVYNFTTTNQEGTFWWHSHYKSQYVDGLKGPIIIRNPASNDSSLYTKEYTLQLTDWYHQESTSILETYLNSTTNPEGIEPLFDSGLINNQGQYNCSHTSLSCVRKHLPRFTTRKGGVTRLRVINMAAMAAFEFSIDGHSLTVIEADGVRTEPYTVDALTINSAQRYSVLVESNQKVSNYWIRATIYHGSPWTPTVTSHSFNPHVFGIFSYHGGPFGYPQTKRKAKLKVLDDMQLSPVPPMPAPTLDHGGLKLLFRFEFQMLPGDLYQKPYITIQNLETGETLVGGNSSSGIKGGTYAPPYETPTLLAATLMNRKVYGDVLESVKPVVVKNGQVIQMIIVNSDAGEHPFHLHGHTFFILASGTGSSVSSIPQTFENPNPLRRDVVTVPGCPSDIRGECLEGQFGYVVVRFPADNPGVWLFHCHIEWHAIAGLAMTFIEAPDALRELSIPKDTEVGCEAYRAWKESRIDLK